MLLKIVAEGVVGTAIMTAVMYLIALVSKDRFKVVKILGTMLTFQTTPQKGLSDKPSAITVGIFAHYLVGIGFAAIYHWLWSNDILHAGLFFATLLGFANGVIGAIGWAIFVAIHPNPPKLPLKSYLVAIIIGHIFFAYGIWITYLIIEGV
jgi:hypothetical protein